MADEKPVRRRDDEGRWQVARTWESLIDRQIREAMDEGKFDDLPHQGAPLPSDDNPHAGEWGLAFHVLRNAGYAPPWIEADKEVRGLRLRLDTLVARAATDPPLTEIARARDRATIERLVNDTNAAVARVNSEAPSASQHRRPLDLAEQLRRYEDACRR